MRCWPRLPSTTAPRWFLSTRTLPASDPSCPRASIPSPEADAAPTPRARRARPKSHRRKIELGDGEEVAARCLYDRAGLGEGSALDRKSTRLNSSHGYISYAVFCLKKKKNRSV